MLRRLILLLQGSPGDAEQESFKKVRRSERLSQRTNDHDGLKTPVQTKHQLPSPLTNPASEGTNEFTKEATVTPPDGRPGQTTRAHDDENCSQPFAFSSPPQDATQAFSQQDVDPNAPLSDEVEDEVKEGVWGYLLPLDTRHGGTCVVLRKRDTCPLPATPSEPTSAETISRRGGRRGRAPPEERAGGAGSLPSGGYLIGRHPECGKL